MKLGLFILIPLLFRNGTALNECDKCKCCKGGADRCQYYNSFSGYCLEGCIEGYFGDRCLHACMDNCLHWSYVNSCTKCSDGYYGTYCNKCPDNCVTCSSQYDCQICKDGYYSGKQYDNEVEVSFTDCRNKCQANCTSCTSYNECTECEEGFYNGKQYTNSTVSYFDCRHSCQSNCKACTSYYHCTECADGKYNSIYSNCSESCNPNCKECSSQNTCNACVDGKYNNMFNNCSESCSAHCKTCISENKCSSCHSGKYGHICQIDCGIGCVNSDCDINDGRCICRANFQGDKCDQCVDGKYGSDCDLSCPLRCANNSCESNGECYSCISGFSGNTCDACVSGKYGTDCDKLCPRNCRKNSCYSNGGCYSCKAMFSGNMCDECVSGKYGTECDMTCPTGCKNNLCKINGDCYQCITGFSGNRCRECEHGKYGTDCNIACSTNCANSSCKSEGDCYSCKTGFTGTKCDTCIGRKYGDNCKEDCPKTCTVCISETNCTACEQRYWGNTCQPCPSNCLNCSSNKMCLSCKPGLYGHTCHERCNQNCRNGLCDKENERCSIGCIDGFYEDMCDHKCSPNCVRSECERKSGDCLYGCKTGFTGTSCAKAISLAGSTEYNKNVMIGSAAGGGLIVVIVVIVVVLLFRKRHRRDNSQEHYMAEMYETLDRTSSTVTYSTLITDSQPVERNDAAQFVHSNTSVRDSVARTSATQTFREYVNETQLEMKEEIDSKTATFNRNKLVAPHETDDEAAVTYYNVTAVKKRKITLDKLQDFVEKKTKADFIEEFRKLPEGLIKPYVDSQSLDNLSKIRYKGVYPYHATRIRLKDCESDFINASYIDGYSKRKAYIASIGPTYKNMGYMSAFWVMVWQEKVGKIVMLNDIAEIGASNYDQYWPNKDLSLIYANIQVMCLSDETYADYTVRNFTVQKDFEKRNVYQIHFTAWPYNNTSDDVTSLIEFRQRVISIKTELEGPIIVHCSAGIGRTGTYIALDSLTEEGEAEGGVDIYACVRNLQRVKMVQTVEQYQFLHNAIVQTLTFDSKAVEASKFVEYMTTHTDDYLTEMFRRLEASVGQRSDDEKEAVKRNQALENKNRNGADIPGDRNRPKLLGRKPSFSGYINAVYVNSYTTRNHYLVAQSPLPDTVADFLTLIIQEEVSCIVNMEADSADDKTIGTYHLSDNQILKKGTFTVKSEREKSTAQYVLQTLKILHLRNDQYIFCHQCVNEYLRTFDIYSNFELKT